MKTEIVINATAHETRIAILEDSKLVEVWVERPENERMVGDIYKGKVSAVIPGINAAFVDIGMERSAFLHVSDISDTTIDFAAQFDMDVPEGDEEEEPKEEELPRKKPKRGLRYRDRDKKYPSIESLVSKDQEILVQVTKEPISTKGARVTSQISLPGRFFVLVPGQSKVGVSRKIASWHERKRLRILAKKYQPKRAGLIIRTVAEGKNENEIASEIKGLTQVYHDLMKKAEQSPTPSLIHKEMGMTSGVIRDLLGEDVDGVVVDSKEHYDEMRKYLEATSSNLVKKVVLYSGKEPIFDHYDLEREIESIFSRKLWLKIGGFLVLDHTEALTVIDVNSGRYVGKSNYAETVLNINMAAASEIARQLRLRDIGGIIVIDFIDMDNMKHRKKVEDVFVNALKHDRSKITISQISELGLMEMTRQRVRPSLIYTFAESCPVCGGIGMVQSRETTVTKIERWLARAEVFGKEKSYTLFVHPSVFEYLIENSEERLTLLRSTKHLSIDILVDSKLSIEEFHVFSTTRGVDVTDEFNVGKRVEPGEKEKQPSMKAPEPVKSFPQPQKTEERSFGRKPRTRIRKR